MISNIFILRALRKIRSQLRGAKKLRDKDKIFFVPDTVNILTEVNLGLQEKDFPKALIGNHSDIAEILLRQIFLKNFGTICKKVMQHIGDEKPITIPIPNNWRKHLEENGIKCSNFLSEISLFTLSIKQIIIGFIKSLHYSFPIGIPKYPGSPYTVFVSIKYNNLPVHNNNCYDIISWYKKSKIRKPKIKIIWAQVIDQKGYRSTNELIVSSKIFPKLNSPFKYIKFFYKNIYSLFVAIFGVLIGKWWYGFLYYESIYYNYLSLISSDKLAHNYLFSNSDWYHKPLWTFEAEQKGSTISLYSYSINMHKLRRTEYKNPDTYGLKIMSWNDFIVWDKEQLDFFYRYCPKANYTIVGYIDWCGLPFKYNSSNNKKVLSIYDVTPGRPTFFTSIGYVYAPYKEDDNLRFLKDIIEVFYDNNWEILWKRKRFVNSHQIPKAFLKKQSNLIRGKIIEIDPNYAASSIIESSDAIISFPFSTPSIIAKMKNKPSIYYDTSGYINRTERGGVPVLKSKAELKEWYKYLSYNSYKKSY